METISIFALAMLRFFALSVILQSKIFFPVLLYFPMVNERKTFFFGVVLCCVLPLMASALEVVPTNWSWSGNGAEPVSLDGKLPLSVQTAAPSGAADGITLTADFSLPSGWTGPLGIMLYKNNMACRVYVNNVYVETLGRLGPDFFFQPYISRGVWIPESLLKLNNSLRLELWNDTGTYKLRMIDFMDEATYRASVNRFNFLDVQLPRFATMLLLFVAIYSMFLFINYRKKTESLFLSLGAAFFAIYLLNVTAFDAPVPYLPLKAFLYSCFPLSILFLFRFFRIFLKIKTSNRVMWVITGLGVLFTLGYYIQRNTAALDSWHSAMLIYPVAAIVYAFIGVLSSFRRKEMEQIPILVGLVAAVALSAYDMYYFFLNLTPFILLQGIGFMCLILGTFYSFSQEIADKNRKCEEYALDMEINKDTRDALFTQIRQDAEKSEDIGAKLDESVERVGSLVSQYLVSVDQINKNLSIQSDHVSSNKKNIEEIFSAIDRTSVMVSQHEAMVKVTVDNIRELTDGIHRTDGLVKESGKTLERLSGACLAADKDVSESLRFVDDLASYSQNINEIVKSISDLAEQTNILSINAAIEAARSGQMGKGFAVVAGEIRSLATRSGSSAAQINVILGTMVEKIRNIQKQESQVSARLRDIMRENGNIDVAISEIFKVLEAQLERNAAIGESVGELVTAVHSILGQTESQKSNGEVIRQSVLKLESITNAIVVSSGEQKQCNEELKNNLEQLRTVSDSNLEVLSDLQNLFE